MNIETRGRTTGGELDPQIQHVLAAVERQPAGEAKPLWETTADEIRAAPDPIEMFALPAEPIHEVRDMTLSGAHGYDVMVRVYRPAPTRPLPILVFFHGGCWVFGSLDTHDSLCRYFSNHAGCLVVSVDYRLAPEHRFPAGVEDAYGMTGWLAEHAGEIGGDPTRIAVGGDSAGGNIAAVVAQMARNRGEPEIGYQLLIYPITDISSFDTSSYRRFCDGFLSQEMMEWAGELYINDDEERRHPYVSPLLAPNLADLPPALVLTAEADILRDEGEAYARRLAAAGNEVRCIRYQGMSHAFVAMAGLVDAGKIALQDCVSALRDSFSRPAAT